MLAFLLVVGVLAVGGHAMYSPSSGVIDLNEKNFAQVLGGDEVWVVEFYAPWCGHCQQLVPEYQKAAKALKGVAKVGAVNADEQKDLGSQFGVRGFPTIKIFGADKKNPQDYNGGRTADAIAEAALSALKSQVKARLGGGGSSSKSSSSDDVVELTDSNFDKLVMQSEDMWLVEFYAPWCGHCKNLAPHWARAAGELKGKVKLGAVDATVHQLKAQKYGIQGYPTIKFFPPGKKDADSVQEYDGGRTASDIVTWANEKLSENIAAPDVVQLINPKIFKEACENKPLCVISVLPHILDCTSSCRNEYLELLKDMGGKYRKKMWGWIWTEGGQQTDLESALDIGGFGYPAMAVVNVKKMKYSILRGSFSFHGVDEFLRDLSYGRGNTAPVKGGELPKIYKTEEWDGKDGELPVEEDLEFSLDDDFGKDEL